MLIHSNNYGSSYGTSDSFECKNMPWYFLFPYCHGTLFLSLIDNYSRCGYGYLLSQRLEALDCFKCL